MSTTYGNNIKLTIYGGSHDDEIGMRLSGIKAGEEIDLNKLYSFMKRRAPGQNAYSTKRKEADMPIFLSGMNENITNGDVIHAIIKNTNQHSGDYSSLKDIPRPSHADYAAIKKYNGNVDLRGGGHFSGRLTALMCVAGGIILQILERQSIKIASHIYSIKDVYDTPFDLVDPTLDIEALSMHTFPVISEEKGTKMQNVIEEARLECDSVGGVIETAITGLPVGLGEHMFMGVEGRISSIIFSIPAVKGIEFGNGFDCSKIKGTENNDPFYTDGKNIYTKTNNSGGILGGMSDGMPIIFRAAMKPTPSIGKEQDSVSLSKMENVKLNIVGRHDPCVVPRAVPVHEACAAIAIYDILLDK